MEWNVFIAVATCTMKKKDAILKWHLKKYRIEKHNNKSIIERVNYWRYRTVLSIFRPQFFGILLHTRLFTSIGHVQVGVNRKVTGLSWLILHKVKVTVTVHPACSSAVLWGHCVSGHVGAESLPTLWRNNLHFCLSSFSWSHPLLPCLGWSSIHTVLTISHFVGIIFIGKIRGIHSRKPFYTPSPPPPAFSGSGKCSIWTILQLWGICLAEFHN